MITTKRTSSFIIISDPHLIANDLHDDGPAFQRMQKTSAGKDLVYEEIVLSCFIKYLIKKRPAALIITGDITFNGAKISAQRFSELMQPLVACKIAVLILPGNHDIFDGWARKFKDDYEYRVKEVSPSAWRQIFSYSYQQAVACDKNSLAYSVDFNPDYLLILADSNIYGAEPSLTHPITNGYINNQQLSFIRQQLQKAKEQNQQVLFFMHHNLYAHNMVVNNGFVLDNAQALRKLLTAYQVKVVFSGHIHAQNIVLAVKDCSATEIVSSCFSATDQGFGLVNLTPKTLDYQRFSFSIRPYLSAKQKENQDLQDFHSYLYNIFAQTTHAQTRQTFSEYRDQPAQLAKINQLLTRLHWLYFTGTSYQNRAELQNLHSSSTYRWICQKKPFFKDYLDSLMNTKVNSQHCIIKFQKD